MFVQETHSGNPLAVYYDDASPSDYIEKFTPEENTTLDHINRKVADTDSLVEIADFLLSACKGITATDRLCFTFLEEEGLRAFSKVVKTSYQPILLKEGYSRDIREGSLLQVIKRGFPRVISDLPVYAELHPESRTSVLLAEEGVRSSMTCPLMLNDKIVGLLFRNAKKPAAYGIHEVMLHLATAERLSQTVEKVYRIDQMEAANRNYTEMLSFVSHELKSPLGSIVMDSNIILDGYLGEVNDTQKKKLKTMADKAEYLLRMIDDYLTLSRIENTELEADMRRGADFVQDILTPALNIITSSAEAKHIRVETDTGKGLSSVSCDPDLMRIVMVNLLSNAVKYGVENGLVKVHASIQGENLEVRVYNTGPGFPESAKNKLFRKFSRIQTPELMARKGTGVGLYTVWRIIRLHGGIITADAEEGAWAQFSFSIPGHAE